jgi:hypothetical protein
MRRASAIRHLTAIAEGCQRMAGLWEEEDDCQPFVAAVYAFGELVDGAAEVECAHVAFVLNLPADEVTWGSVPDGSAWLVNMLRLDKIPVLRYWRPVGSPVTNHLIVRPLRIWSADDGIEEQALEALRSGSCESLRLPSPPVQEAEAQLTTELAASLAQLQAVEANYWEPKWRREHRGGGIYPESHLWEAVHGYLELLTATTGEHGPGSG